MSDSVVCWQCGEALTDLILPMSRRQECAACGAEQHVCKLCFHYNPNISGSCDEDRAEDVREKERANFCDYFSPKFNAYQQLKSRQSKDSIQQQAEAELAALFGDDDAESHTKNDATTNTTETETPKASTTEAALSELEKLFGKDK